MRGLERRRQIAFVDRKAMILAGDEDTAGLEILHRMIRAMVAELHLHGARATREAEQLVTETDAEGRQVRDDQCTDRFDGVVARLGIARSIREEHTIGLEREYFFGGGLRGHHRHAAAAVGEHPQDVAFHAVVEGDYVQPLVRTHHRAVFRLPQRTFIPLVLALGGHHLREVHALQARKFLGSADRGSGVYFFAGHDATGLRTLLAQDAREFARVDAGDGDDLVPREEFAQVFARPPVAGERRQVSNYQARGIGRWRLEIFGRRARVADVWIGQRHDLTRVRRIGKNFLITGQRGIENDFATSVALGADRLAVEDGPIFKSQNRGYSHAGTPLEPAPAR